MIHKCMTCLSLLILIGVTPTDAQNARQPNVVIIYGDDVGFGDVGAYGSTKIPTPNIDRLAAQGLVFTDGHCAAATCTPSRFSLLTGVHGFRHGVRILRPNAPLSIPTHILTLPKLFKQAGYTTAVIGKWHLGIGKQGAPVDWNGKVTHGPHAVGFDTSFLLPSTNDRVPCVYLRNGRVVGLDPRDPISIGKERVFPNSTAYPNGKTTPEAMTYYRSTHGHNNSVINGIGRIGYMYGGKAALWDDETMADVFVEEARTYLATKKDKPFFLYFSSQDIHVPRAPHPRFQGKTELGYRGDAMVQFDWSTGEIMKALEVNGLAENTMVIFSSDNGPVYDDGYDDGTTVKTSSKAQDGGHFGAGPYRGGKYQIYEGGTRVPFIIRWPGRVQPGRSDALVNQVDLLASFAALLDIPLADDQAPDSRNLLDAFLGKSTEGHTDMIEEARTLALRHKQWKYIPAPKAKKNKAKAAQLYDLSQDVGEQNNVVGAHPEQAESMAKTLQHFVDAGRVRAKRGTDTP